MYGSTKYGVLTYGGVDAGIEVFTEDIADSATLTVSLTDVGTFLESIADSATLTDTLVDAYLYTESISDSATCTTSLTDIAVFVENINDSAVVTVYLDELWPMVYTYELDGRFRLIEQIPGVFDPTEEITGYFRLVNEQDV